MKLFDVYPVNPVEIVKGKGANVWDDKGREYLDFYGGHAVISIGHSHPTYVERVSTQLQNLGFYSNSIEIPIQKELAEKLGELSGYEDFSLFLCNSGAEATENAVKLASFHNGKKEVITFKSSFHGRTSLAVAITDNASVQAPVNKMDGIHFCEMNDIEAVEKLLKTGKISSVIIEGIQGIGGIKIPEDSFLQQLSAVCKKYEAVLILDEIQSGYGRSGKFFAHQYAGITPDLITVAKGMGNGFPVGGVLISPEFKASYGLLGTTFGGNHLACAASLAVLEVMKDENLINNAEEQGLFLMDEINKLNGVIEVRGRGLMIGVDMLLPVKELRSRLLNEFGTFTGNAKNPNTLRLLPPLSITRQQCEQFLKSFKTCLAQ